MYHYYYPINPGRLLMVALSDSPTGPFEHVGVVEAGSTNGHVGDMNVFKDEDGSAYVIYDDTGFNIRMDRLSDDYLTSHKDGIIVVPKVQEAPAIVRFNGKYLIASSGVQEFDPTETTLVVTDSVRGPYSEKQVLSEKSTWRSQITDMFYVPEGDYVMVMCDQWLILIPTKLPSRATSGCRSSLLPTAGTVSSTTASSRIRSNPSLSTVLGYGDSATVADESKPKRRLYSPLNWVGLL